MNRGFGSLATRSFISKVAWLPVFVFLLEHFYDVALVEGRSMQPTLNPDDNRLKRDVVLLNRLAALRHRYQRGDVVTLCSPTDPSKTIIKRIVAVEGDYVYPLKPHPKEIVRIPKGHCWIEGDENFHSKDSNIYGPVPLGLITAKVTHIVWPLSRLGRVPYRGRPERVLYGAGPSDEEEDDTYKPNFA